MLEHDVDAILMDLLLYDDLELALKALTLLIQKYDSKLSLFVTAKTPMPSPAH